MDPFTIATIASSVFGGASSILGGKSAKKAAAQAAAQQQQATLAAQQGVRQATQQATARLQPYSTEGAAARRGYNALLGLPTATTGTVGANGQVSGGGKDWAGYEQQWKPTTINNPTSPWHQYWQQAQQQGKSWGEAFYDWSGGQYGEPGEMPGQSQVSTPQDIEADRTAAYAAFDKSPYAAAADYGEQKAQQTIMGNAGANGRVLSGRTANLTQANATGFKANALLDYMNQLNGVGQRGYEADTNIGNAAIGAAQTVGNYGVQGAANSSNALLAGSQAQQSGMQNAGLILANALGTYGGYKSGQTSGTKPGSYYGGSSLGGALGAGANGLVNPQGQGSINPLARYFGGG